MTPHLEYDQVEHDLIMHWFETGALAGSPTGGSATITAMERADDGGRTFTLNVYTKEIDHDDPDEHGNPKVLDLTGVTIDHRYDPEECGDVYVTYHCKVTVPAEEYDWNKSRAIPR